MAIDIKQINTAANISKVSTNKTDPKTDQTGNSPESASASSKSDSVSITTQAQQLQKIQTQLGTVPEIDQEKVAEIKLAIAEGRYKIDAEKLASNIAIFENELKDID
ncbi:flagellar biosynthesis anti-sigma factor FlgM [Shewanella sp. VB17]|uniref:flagellar biosynthesis anti-sigma factor FlgM n=1 Tax=Shewanella sp. VB17 TaxID=2739432 RepID=UPI0015676D93|nr:flagellar biosynthesis anti-sigma factor FlgM [Shewanella sp. VB17]NRD73318.1 flagellar biosynthesis anti-sigma factor FlgM [Shewanella sp. VB17]